MRNNEGGNVQSRIRVGIATCTVLLASVLLVAVSSSASASAASSKTHRAHSASQKTIFVFLYAPAGFNYATQAWAKGVSEGAAHLGSGFNVVLKAQAQLDTDPVAYVNFIQSAMVDNPNGIVVFPSSTAEAAGIQQVVSQTHDPIVFADQPLPSVKPQVAFVGTNNIAAGAQAAGYLLKQYKAHKLVSNQVAILRQAPGASSTDQRYAGFVKALKHSPLHIVSTITGAQSTTLPEAKADMQNILAAHPKVGSVYSVTDIFAVGAALEIKAKARKVQQVSIDATEPGVKDILSHSGINAEVAQHLTKVGYTAVVTLGEAMLGKTEPSVIDTGTELVTKTNAKVFLKTLYGVG